jgi:hypothetical protein
MSSNGLFPFVVNDNTSVFLKKSTCAGKKTGLPPAGKRPVV